MINLALLIQVNMKNYSNEIAKLKLLAQELNTLQVKSANLKSNTTLVSGERMFSSHLYNTNNETLVRENSVINDFAYFNLTNCRNALINFYNLTDDSDIIFQMNNFNASLSERQVNTYTMSAFNSHTIEKLDIDICANITESIQMPLSNLTNFNLTQYKELKKQGVDMLNPNDDYYNDRCKIYDSELGSDTTLGYRRTNYLGNQIPQCFGFNCEYNGITRDAYINCTCGIKTDSEMFNEAVNIAVDSIAKINLAIAICPNAIIVIVYLF
jgi:hypothetical protein